MIRLSFLGGKIYGVRGENIYNPDTVENIDILVSEGTPVLLIDVDDYESITDFIPGIDPESVIWA